MLFEPKNNTLPMEPVGAWQHGNLVTFVKFVDADSALSFAFGTKHLLVDPLLL
jgi:hypothetical protein